jgi:hypothetical protein
LDHIVAAGYSRGIPLESDSDRSCGDTRLPRRSDRGSGLVQTGDASTHANCVENLPVFGAIVFGLYVGNVGSALVNALAVAVLAARIMQSLVHVCFVQTDIVTVMRFGFFFVQIISFLWLTVILLMQLSGSA